MNNVTITESVGAALAAIKEELAHKHEFIEKNETGGDPLCGYDDWDEMHADFNERLAELGEHLADAMTEMIGGAGRA